MTAPRTATARTTPRRASTGGSHAARNRPRARKGTSARRPKARAGAKTSQRRVRVTAPPRGRRFPLLVTSFVIVGMVVVGVVSLQAVVSQGSFRMQQLARHNQELEHEYGRLKLQVAELSSPGRIAKEARDLGYRLPSPDEVRTLAVKGGADRPPAARGTLGRPVLSLKKELGQGP
jgi:cell division protein FtsL